MYETKIRKTLTHWPSPQDYNEALQNPQVVFKDPGLKSALAELDQLGLPKPVSGGFASVYKLVRGEESWAVRCFLRNVDDLELRYDKISQFLKKCALSNTISFQYLSEGIKINGSCYPILKMSWVEGTTLEAYIEANLDNPVRLKALPQQFLDLCRNLCKAGIAHGDLQHGNILVTREGLVLVDYDGMFVPSLDGLRSNELGHRNYQHPRRREHHFGNYVDNFSQWVIYTSLVSVARDPRLFKALGGGADCLLFRQNDFDAPQESAAFATLENHSDARIVRLARFLREQTYRSVERVEPLNENPAEVRLPSITLSVPAGDVVCKDSWWSDQVGNDVEQSSAGRSDAPIPTEVEPELQKSCPRRVRMDFENGRVHPVFKQLIVTLFPHFWVPVALTAALIMSSIVITYGHDVTGAVVAKPLESFTSKNGSIGHRYHVEYNYKDKFGVSVDSKLVDQSEYDKVRIGDPVFVRVLESVPIVHEMRLSRDEVLQPVSASFFFPFGLIILGVEVALWHEAFKHYGLIRKGAATTGRIERKWIDIGNKGTQYHRCSYKFTVNGSSYSGKMDIGKSSWAEISENESVTVVFDPTKPDSHCIYRFAYFKART